MKCMKAFIKSKFKKDTIYWTIPFNIFVLLMSVMLIINCLKKFILNDIDVFSAISGLLLFGGGSVLLINLLKIRFIIVSHDSLKYFSFWHPFGKVLHFIDFVGKIVTHETGSAGGYKVLYLVDRNNRTAFKIMGLHYENFDEINNAISLKKMNYTPTVGQYFRLLIFGRITLNNMGNPKDEGENLVKVLRILKIVSVIGVGLFVLGSILKMILK